MYFIEIVISFFKITNIVIDAKITNDVIINASNAFIIDDNNVLISCSINIIVENAI